MLAQMLQRMRRCASCARETPALEMLTNEAMLREARLDLDLISRRGDPMEEACKAPQPLQTLTRGVNIVTRRRNVLSSLHLRCSQCGASRAEKGIHNARSHCTCNSGHVSAYYNTLPAHSACRCGSSTDVRSREGSDWGQDPGGP